MIVVPYQEIMKEKLARQAAIKELQYHASGHCIHIGEISPGCRRCFTGEQGTGIQVGAKCNANCPYCYYDPNRQEETTQSINSKLADFFFYSQEGNWQPNSISYQSSGETLMYMEELEKFAAILDQIQNQTGINQYRFMYTNGTLADKEMLKRIQDIGTDEIRFHLSASNFSKTVYKNMEEAAKLGFFITVEEPSWPHHREELFEMLPILDSVGGKHLDMVEVQITAANRDAIEKNYPKNTARAYMDNFYHLYDEGLVYDIMEEVIKKKYGFSVIDCNSGVERCRSGNNNKVLFDPSSMDGACRDWKYR
jgi:pyruvate formate-lyase activating enzyme-like uncharacterized protein